MTWNVRIGINPISWMNDDLPSLGGDTLLETALAEGREIGYEGFELGNKFPKDGPALKAKLAGFDLACVSGWYSGFLPEDSVSAEIERCREHMRKLQFNNATVVVYGECAGTIQGQIDTPLARRPRFTDPTHWKAYGDRLNIFGAHLQSTYGITLAYHHHIGAYVESPADIDLLMAATDGTRVGLLFDTGHAWYGGATDVVALLRKHVARVVHVHCKDIRPKVIAQARNDGWSFLTGVLNGTLSPSVLDTYQQERKTHARRLIDLALTVGRAMTSGGRFGDLVRRTVVPRLHLLPGMRDKVLDSTTPPLPRSALVHKTRAPRQLAGTLCPNTVIDSGQRLDSILGTGFAVVCAHPLTPGEQTAITDRGAVVHIAESGGELAAWMASGNARAALIRPDRTVMRAGRNVAEVCGALPTALP
jgi:inosose dehydratase